MTPCFCELREKKWEICTFNDLTWLLSRGGDLTPGEIQALRSMGIAVGKPYHQVELQSGHQGYSSAHGGHQGSPGYLAPHPVSHPRPKGTPGQHAAHRSKSTEFLFDDAPPLGPPHQVPAPHHIEPPDLFNTNNHHSRRYRCVQGQFVGWSMKWQKTSSKLSFFPGRATVQVIKSLAKLRWAVRNLTKAKSILLQDSQKTLLCGKMKDASRGKCLLQINRAYFWTFWKNSNSDKLKTQANFFTIFFTSPAANTIN